MKHCKSCGKKIPQSDEGELHNDWDYCNIECFRKKNPLKDEMIHNV